MGIEEILGSKREEILRLAAKHGARNVRVFGEVARGEAGPGSEVDFLIDVGTETSPWFPGGLVSDLEDLLGRDVHVAFASALPSYAKHILQEAVEL
ncbi:MAG TPA: nucleotidyltransferase domain-containing protein [Thermoanaerobaculia bacterium]